MRTCEDGWRLGWHEAHGGNLSYRLPGEDVERIKEELTFDRPWLPLSVSVPGLGGELFLLTAGGSCFRDVMRKPEKTLGIVQVSPEGEAYRICWGLDGGAGRPTSELPAHLMNHQIKKQVSGGAHRTIYHAHPSNIIALSFVLPPSDQVFTRELWEMEPECAMTFPQGIGVIPWKVPGQREISCLSGEMMKRYDVILWAQHGLFCSAPSPWEALGLMHTVEKSAEMLVKVLSMTSEKRYYPSADQFREMSQALGLKLPERFLYDKQAPGGNP